MYPGIGRSLSTDYFLIADQLTREEFGYLRRTRNFVDNEVLPVINAYWEAPSSLAAGPEDGHAGHRRRPHRHVRLPRR